MAIRRDKIEHRLARIERLAREQLDQVGQLRGELGRGESADEMWARMLYQVLKEVDKRGGSVPREKLLEIGESAGYGRQGLAGHYQRLFRLEEGVTYLTEEGRKRLALLDERFKVAR